MRPTALSARAAPAAVSGLLLALALLAASTAPPPAIARPTKQPEAPTLRLAVEHGGEAQALTSHGDRAWLARHSRILEHSLDEDGAPEVVARLDPLGPAVEAMAADAQHLVVAAAGLRAWRREPTGLRPLGRPSHRNPLRAPVESMALAGDEVWLIDSARRLARVRIGEGVPSTSLPLPSLPRPPFESQPPRIQDIVALPAPTAVPDDPPDAAHAPRIVLLVRWVPADRSDWPLTELLEFEVGSAEARFVGRTEVPAMPEAHLLTAEVPQIAVIARDGSSRRLTRDGATWQLLGPLRPAAEGTDGAYDAALVGGRLWLLHDQGLFRREGDRILPIAGAGRFDGGRARLAPLGGRLLVASWSDLWSVEPEAAWSEARPGPSGGPFYDAIHTGPDALWLRTSDGHAIATDVAPPALLHWTDGAPVALDDLLPAPDGALYGLDAKRVLALRRDDSNRLRVELSLPHEGRIEFPPTLLSAAPGMLVWRDGRGQVRLWWPPKGASPSVARAIAGGANALSANVDGRLLWMRLLPAGLSSYVLAERHAEPGSQIALPGMTARRAPVRDGVAWIGAGRDVLAIDTRLGAGSRVLEQIDLPGTVLDLERHGAWLWVLWRDGVVGGIQLFAVDPPARLRPIASTTVGPIGIGWLATHEEGAVWLLSNGAVQRFEALIPPPPTGSPRPTITPPATPTAPATPTPSRARTFLPRLIR